jgi:hypothetical protein
VAHSSSLFDLVCGCTHSTFIRQCTTERVLIHLGHPPSLKTLIFSDISSDMLRLLTTDNRPPSLTDLNMYVCQWSVCQTIMDSMRCQFIDLSIRTRPPTAPQSLSWFMQSFLQHPCTLSLSSISLSDTTIRFQDDSDVGTSVSNTFRPPFACTQLKSVLLNFTVSRIISVILGSRMHHVLGLYSNH